MAEKQYVCGLCEMAFPLDTLYRDHLKEQHGPEYMCNVCQKMFFSEKAANRHDCQVRKSRPFVCSKCEKKFVCKAGLSRHFRIHTPYNCTFKGCSKGFEKYQSFKRHLRGHEAKKKIQACMVCLKEFSDFKVLVKHMKSHSGSSGKDSEPVNEKEPCTSEPIRAILYKKSNKLYACNTCQEEFSFPSQLSEHMIMHSGSGEDSEPIRVKELHTCSTCQEEFSFPSQLSEHMIMHSESGEKDSERV